MHSYQEEHLLDSIKSSINDLINPDLIDIPSPFQELLEFSKRIVSRLLKEKLNLIAE